MFTALIVAVAKIAVAKSLIVFFVFIKRDLLLFLKQSLVQ